MNKLSDILKTRTVIDISISSAGTLINGLLGLLFFIVLARALGPGDFGLLVVSIATLTLISDIADFGINTGLINFVGRFKTQSDQAYKYLKLGLESKVLLWILILPIGWFLAPVISTVIFQKIELTRPLQLVMIGIGGSLLFSFTTNALQSLGRYWQWSLVNILSNGLRLLMVVYLIIIGTLGLDQTIWVYIGILFFGFFFGLVFLPIKFLTVKNESSVAKEFFHYNKWIAAFVILAAISSRLDTFISARLLPVQDLGIYGAALQLSSAVPQVVFAIAAAIAPKLASLTNDQQAIAYVKKLQLLVLAVALVGLLGVPISYLAIPWLYGADYQASILPFTILLIAQLIFLISIPTHQAVFYYFQKPSLFVSASVLRLVVTLIGGWMLISSFGILGAAVTVLVGSIVDFIIPFIWVIRRFSRTR